MAVEPKFSKPVDKMKDQQLINGMQRIIDFFHRNAREGYCKGDLFGGWDWPTMNAVFPDLCAKWRELRDECHKRLEATGGVLAGREYEKKGETWKVKG